MYGKSEFVPTENGLEVVATSFYNYTMPLLRYATGDYIDGEINDTGDCKCGSSWPYALGIKGRSDDYVILKDGRQIGRLDVVFKEIDNLIECQLEQTLLTELVVRYVPMMNANIQKVERAINKGLKERLG